MCLTGSKQQNNRALRDVKVGFGFSADIAVGAPFDEDGKVFIYRGSDAGIETKPAQVTLAKKIFK